MTGETRDAVAKAFIGFVVLEKSLLYTTHTSQTVNYLYYSKVLASFSRVPKLKDAFSFDELMKMLAVPPREDMGDLAFPCFQCAGIFGQSPDKVAEYLVGVLERDEDFAKVEARGPFVNFFFDRVRFVNQVVDMLLFWITSEQDHQCVRAKERVVLDFSSPNIAKPFSIAHLRSTSIGNSLAHIFKYLGYEVIRINHLGDWGTSFGKLICAYRLWGEEYGASDSLKNLFDLYVRFHKEAEHTPALEKQAKEAFHALESGDQDSMDLWKRFKSVSLHEFERIYGLLGIEFDHYTGESFYRDKIPLVFHELEEKALLRESQGATLVNFSEYSEHIGSEGESGRYEAGQEALPPLLLRKDDGSTLYATRDIAAALYRFQEFGFDRMLYVVGMEQSLHFKQVFQTLALMGKDWAKRCEHVGFGLIQLKDKKMSTREGTVVFLEDVIHKIKEIALEHLCTSIPLDSPNTDTRHDSALQLAVSSVIFADLKTTRLRNVLFDWEEMLNPKGETGVYLQYTHARLSSIIDRFTSVFGPSTYDTVFSGASRIKETHGFNLAKELSKFQDTLMEAKEALEPSILAQYLLDLAQSFSSYYQQHQIVNEKDPATSLERLKLVVVVKHVLSDGLRLLGITPMDRV